MALAAPNRRFVRLPATAAGRAARTLFPVAQPVAKAEVGAVRMRALGQVVRLQCDGNTSSVVPSDRTSGELKSFPVLHWALPHVPGEQLIPVNRAILPVPCRSRLLFAPLA